MSAAIRRDSHPSTTIAHGDHMFEQDERAAAPVDPRVAAAVIDVFVYVVVLNLFVEYFPQVLSD